MYLILFISWYLFACKKINTFHLLFSKKLLVNELSNFIGWESRKITQLGSFILVRSSVFHSRQFQLIKVFLQIRVYLCKPDHTHLKWVINLPFLDLYLHENKSLWCILVHMFKWHCSSHNHSPWLTERILCNNKRIGILYEIYFGNYHTMTSLILFYLKIHFGVFFQVIRENKDFSKKNLAK